VKKLQLYTVEFWCVQLIGTDKISRNCRINNYCNIASLVSRTYEVVVTKISSNLISMKGVKVWCSWTLFGSTGIH